MLEDRLLGVLMIIVSCQLRIRYFDVSPHLSSQIAVVINRFG